MTNPTVSCFSTALTLLELLSYSITAEAEERNWREAVAVGPAEQRIRVYADPSSTRGDSGRMVMWARFAYEPPQAVGSIDAVRWTDQLLAFNCNQSTYGPVEITATSADGTVHRWNFEEVDLRPFEEGTTGLIYMTLANVACSRLGQ